MYDSRKIKTQNFLRTSREGFLSGFWNLVLSAWCMCCIFVFSAPGPWSPGVLHAYVSPSAQNFLLLDLDLGLLE